jgi:hypothetical protein
MMMGPVLVVIDPFVALSEYSPYAIVNRASQPRVVIPHEREVGLISDGFWGLL